MPITVAVGTRTAQNLIDEALRDLGVLASGASGDATESAEALVKLNRMIDTWQMRGFMIYEIRRMPADESIGYTLVAGQNPYTIGSGGDINIPRPTKIYAAGLLLNGETVETPLDIFETFRDWQMVPDKTVQGPPSALYYDGAFTVNKGNIWTYPTPDAAHQLAIYIPSPIESVASLATVMTYPPGYEECLLYNLELRLAPSYGVPISEDIRRMARESVANIQRLNARTPNLQSADAGVGKGGTVFRDHLTGGFV